MRWKLGFWTFLVLIEGVCFIYIFSSRGIYLPCDEVIQRRDQFDMFLREWVIRYSRTIKIFQNKSRFT